MAFVAVIVVVVAVLALHDFTPHVDAPQFSQVAEATIDGAEVLPHDVPGRGDPVANGSEGHTDAGDTSVEPQPPNPNAENEPETWTLSDARVVRAGPVVRMSEGTLISDHMIECDATRGTGDSAETRVFSVRLTAFRPNADMPGQSEGLWYVQGTWGLGDGADGSSRHAQLLSGTLSAETPSDPLDVDGDLIADVLVPASIGAAGYARGEGEFEGTAGFDGRLTLHLERRATKA